MRSEAPVTIRPLSPRLASLERSLSKRNQLQTHEPSKSDKDGKLSPRILNKARNFVFDEDKEHLSLPIFTLFESRTSPVPFLSEKACGDLDKETAALKMDTRIEHNKALESVENHKFDNGGDSKTVINKCPQSGCFRDKKKEKKETGSSRSTSPSRIPRLVLKKDQNSNTIVKNNTEIPQENSRNSTLNNSDSTEVEPLSVHSTRSEKSTAINSDISLREAVRDPNIDSNMDHGKPLLLSSMPKKLKEKAVLQTFASNLKLASSASKAFNIPKRQHIEGRLSADSGRESFGAEHEEERPKLYRFDSISSISSTGSTARGNGNNSLKPWTLHMVAESIKKRRQIAAVEGRKSLNELDTLKAKLEQSQAKSLRLATELDPMREKIRRYEGIIESLEDKVEESKQEILLKERSRLAEIDKLEREYSKQLQEERTAKEDIEDELRDEIRKFQNETNSYKKLADELEDSLAMLKENSVVDEENSPMAKQLASLRQELVKVREVLSTSEKERLNERKEKLSALQNMIKLTKAKSDIEEELAERKKADTKESSEKYMQLSGKLAVSELKLKKLRTDLAAEIENLQKKHVEETRELNKSHELAISSTRKELESANEKLKILEEKNRPSSPGKSIPYHGRWSAMRSENRKHLSEMKEIISDLEREGLGPDKCSSDEVVRVLYTRQKEVAEKLKEAENVLSACKNGDPRPVIQELKEERITLKRKVDDLKQNLSSVESQLKLTEMTSKRQMEDLITEKKNSFFELQKSTDDRDNAKATAEQLQKELMDTKSILKRRQNELDMLRDNLMSVTNEMKTVDADLGKTRKDLSIKAAELERLNRDMTLEKERVEQEKKLNSRLQSDVENKKKVIKESERIIAELESKVQRLNENLQASQMHANRASSERDSLKDEVQNLKASMISSEAEIKQSSSVIASLRNQIKSLEHALHEKIDKVSQTSTELEKAKANSLGVSHLLGIEEGKNKELEDEIDDLTYKLTAKNEELEKALERNKILEEESLQLRSSLDYIQVDYAETETSLKSHASTRTILEKELSLLQVQHREVTREKQRLHDILEETKRTLQQKNDRISNIDKELIENKQQLKEKIRKSREVESERDTIQEELTFQRNQNELLNENLDTSKLECRKLLSEIDQLKSQLAEITNRRMSLSDELSRVKETFGSKSDKDKDKLISLQNENDQLYSEIKAAQTLLRKYITALNGTSDFADGIDDSLNEKNITNPLNKFIKRLDKAESDAQTYHVEADKLKLRVQTLNTELEQMTNLMSDEKISLSKEIDKVRDEIGRKLESEKRRYDDDMKVVNEKNAAQNREIQKLKSTLIETEERTSQMEKLITEKESQLRMITQEKEQLLDSVEFLQQEMKNADSHMVSKEEQVQKKIQGKEDQISALLTKQEQILAELRDANKQLMLKDEDESIRSQQVDELIQSLKKDKEELTSSKNEIEQQLNSLKEQMREKENQSRKIELEIQEQKQDLEVEINRLKGKISQKDNATQDMNMELETMAKENQRLQKKVKELIEESENIGGQECQVAQVAQVESAGMGFEMFEAEEKAESLAKENEEMQKQLTEYQKELQRQGQLSQANISLYQQNEQDNQRLHQEVEQERQEKLEALGCLKALIVDNEAMANCVNGLQQTVASQRKENSETRRHLKEVLDKYESQREVSFKTQKTFEDLMETRLSRDQHELTRLHNNLGLMRTDFEETRRERDKLVKQLEHKDKELENTRNEISDLRSIMEKKVINFEVEKRARELLESKMHQFAYDREFAKKRFNSIEDSNKDLQGKLIDMQKRHNNLQQNLTKRTDTGPLTFKALYEDQERREKFLKEQVTALADKFGQIGYNKHSPVYMNTLRSKES